MKTKTRDLIGPALDWVVAILLGKTPVAVKKRYTEGWFLYDREMWDTLEYSTDWSQGGPIIERENIDLISPTPSDPLWQAMQWRFAHGAKGPTPLVAAMRCFVVSRLGVEVDVPEELVVPTTVRKLK